MLKKNELSINDHKILIKYCKKKKLNLYPHLMIFIVQNY